MSGWHTGAKASEAVTHPQYWAFLPSERPETSISSKLNIVTADDGGNWVAMEMGNLLEDLVARIFAKKTGLRIFQRKVMYQHPRYPWMLADLDYLVEQPDGTLAILEIKTTNYNARDKWEYNGEEIVPVYYEAQGPPLYGGSQSEPCVFLLSLWQQ